MLYTPQLKIFSCQLFVIFHKLSVRTILPVCFRFLILNLLVRLVKTCPLLYKSAGSSRFAGWQRVQSETAPVYTSLCELCVTATLFTKTAKLTFVKSEIYWAARWVRNREPVSSRTHLQVIHIHTVYYTAWNISNIVKMLSSVTDSIEGWVTVNVRTVVVLWSGHVSSSLWSNQKSHGLLLNHKKTDGHWYQV